MNRELDELLGGEDGWSPIRFAERRDGERCATCGGPRHPRLILRQAAHVPPPRPRWVRLFGMAIFMGALIYLIAFTTAVAS